MATFPLISNIQRFSVQDGPGVRTTIFFKGCSLHCPWCSNPENISCDIEYVYEECKCIREGNTCRVWDRCPVLTGENLWESKCLTGAIWAFGTEYNVDKFKDVVMRDYAYYGLMGGVTYSGGEPLLHLQKYLDVLRFCRDKQINQAVETALFVNQEKLRSLDSYIDLFYVDVKILNEERCKNILGGDLQQYLKNLDWLFKENKDIVIRMPWISGYTDDEENRVAILKLLEKFRPKKFEILQGHNLAEKKYRLLKREFHRISNSNVEEMERFASEVAKLGLNVEVMKL